MSKASEWAKTARTCEWRRKDESFPWARVNTNGDLEVDGTGTAAHYKPLGPAEALALARWILDTFGEEKT